MVNRDIDRIDSLKLQNENGKQRLYCTFRVPNLLSRAGREFLLTPNALTEIKSVPAETSDRQMPVYHKNTFTIIDSTVFILPEGLTIEETSPQVADYHSRFGDYNNSCNSSSDGSKVIYARKYRLNEFKFPPADFNDLRKFLATVREFDRQKIIITQK